jgi:hypothetical protein
MTGLFLMFVISMALFGLASGYFNALEHTSNR